MGVFLTQQIGVVRIDGAAQRGASGVRADADLTSNFFAGSRRQTVQQRVEQRRAMVRMLWQVFQQLDGVFRQLLLLLLLLLLLARLGDELRTQRRGCQ